MQLGYSTSDASAIVMVGSVGSSLVGPPVGFVIDRFGYPISLFIGGCCIVGGYFGLQYQYDHIFSNVFVSSLMMCLIGTGSTFIQNTVIKKCAVNFPTSRGLATSLPISMIGLSASFYSIVGSTFFPGDTSSFLGFLWISSLVIFVVCFPFMCTGDIMNHHHYPASRTSIESQSIELEEMRTVASLRNTPSLSALGSLRGTPLSAVASPNLQGSSSFKSLSFDSDITGILLFKNLDFWLLCLILCIFAGMGQMYIYSVGYIVKALFGDSKFILSFKDLNDYETLLQQNQQLQVTMISLSNSVGRVFSGIVGDIVTNVMHRSRSWLLLLSTSCLTITQICLHSLTDLGHLWYFSTVIGFFYGFNYSVYPTLVGDKFGMKHFSFNYGMVGMSPMISNFLLNRQFGVEYDSKISKVAYPEKTDLVADGFIYVCDRGSGCYDGVFLISAILDVVGLLIVCALNYRQYLLERSQYRSLSKTT